MPSFEADRPEAPTRLRTRTRRYKILGPAADTIGDRLPGERGLPAREEWPLGHGLAMRRMLPVRECARGLEARAPRTVGGPKPSFVRNHGPELPMLAGRRKPWPPQDTFLDSCVAVASLAARSETTIADGLNDGVRADAPFS